MNIGPDSTKQKFESCPMEAIEAMARIDASLEVDWASGWLRDDFSPEDRRTDWKRYGHERDGGHPGYVSLIVYEGQLVEVHQWRRLIDEEGLTRGIGRLAVV